MQKTILIVDFEQESSEELTANSAERGVPGSDGCGWTTGTVCL